MEDSLPDGGNDNTSHTTDGALWASSDGEPSRPQHRPEMSRHNSLPRSLFAGGSSSIFGPSSSDPPQDRMLERSVLRVPNDTGLGAAGPSFEFDDPVRATADARSPRRLPKVEKDADDPTTPPARARGSRQESTTLTTLSRLFSVQTSTSPEHSRTTSYVQAAIRPATYNRSVPAETAALPGHLYQKGLLEGRHSDITVNAFGKQYKLHRLILDRAPFFSSALSEPWLEANAKEMTVRPDEIDGSITQAAFELALKRLYGAVSPREEDADAVGLFATGCWLEMQDLIDSSIESMLRQMTPEKLSPLIKLMTSNYYGRAGDKILASAKAMLCRDGWNMPLRYWDGVPGDIVREIVGGDGFFIEGEWDRWVLSKRILDRRLKARAIEANLVIPGRKRRVMKAPDTANLMAVRFDTVYRRNSVSTGKGIPDNMASWVSLYTHADVEPLLVLLDEGIHYVHLDYEQLQYIRRAKDCLGLPVMPEKVILNALWQQMELRQKIMNSREADLELGLSLQSTERIPFPAPSKDTTMSITSPSSPPFKGKQKVAGIDSLLLDEAAVAEAEQPESGSWDGNGQPRKFWIPSSDCNIVMGGNAEPVIATSANATIQRHATRMSSTLQPEDVQWAADFAAVTAGGSLLMRPGTAVDDLLTAPEPVTVSYTHCPPFRFSAEFPNPRLLKEKKRVYSRTVFYAGSLWNIYIQKVASSRSKQLGVYLHRAKERETEEVVTNAPGLAQGSVDERIGQLEREMILRSERHEQRRQRRHRRATSDRDAHDGADTDDSREGADATFIGSGGEPSGDVDARHPLPGMKLSQDGISQHATAAGESAQNASGSDSDDSDLHADAEDLASMSTKHRIPTLPPYVDVRPTIKTYFKIYSPSRGGRMLSVYESAPDKFNFSQSWGWKSSTLMLDEGLLGDEDDMADISVGKDDESMEKERRKRDTDGRLKFSVVIGLI